MKINSVVVMAIAIAMLMNTEAKGDVIFNKPKHVIFLIHGIGGDKTHFGHMSKALSNVLNQKNPGTKYIIRSIEYDTGNNTKTPYEFAQDIDVVIKRTTASANFKKNDKISLIMHSQGGLIGSIWMFQSLMSSPGFSTPETIRHVDVFITLGSPFWGAKTAQWGSQFKNVTGQLGIEVPLPYGKRELEQMAFGSDMIFDFRMAMIDPQYQRHIEYLKHNVRFLNIVGVADLLNPLGIFISGTGKYEDDGAVPLASARFDFLYSQAVDVDYADEERLTLDRVNEVDMAPFVMVNAMHRSPLPEVENFAGIAQIPKKCIKDEQCGHPTFSYLWKQVLGEKIEQLDQSLGEFKTFLLDINVRVHAPTAYRCDDLKIEITQLDGASLYKSNIGVSKFYEFYSAGKRVSQKYPNQCRFYFTGSLKKVMDDQTEVVLIKFSGKDLKTRFVEMKLKERYSSFVDIALARRNMISE